MNAYIESPTNLGISQRRACALRQQLQAYGITATIIAIGKGETKPIELSDYDRYTQKDLWALNRRVELLTETEHETKTQAIDCTALSARR